MRFASRFRLLSLPLFLLLTFLVACSHQPPPKQYPLEGRVVGIDPGARQLTIAHQAIPGLMDSMTMPFTVGNDDTWVFRAIALGDQVHATLVMSDHPELKDISFSKGVNSVGDGTSQLHIPQPGEDVPDFTLTNQNGTTIHFRQFRGKPLLVTFIYTRCPFPNYCLRMSHNFAAILQQLQNDPRAFADTQLLSISIDPEHDRPPELRTYGEAYVGRVDPKFQHWQFATGSPQQVRKAADFFGLAYNTKDGQIVHSLSTTLIGPDGKVKKLYTGNSWKPEQVADDFVVATNSASNVSRAGLK